MYREMNEKRTEKQLKRIIRTVIGAGILLLTGGVIFAAILVDMMDHSVAKQLQEETEGYCKRLYDQIHSDFQVIDTVASVIGSSGLAERTDFPELLDLANYKNDFLTMIYMDDSGTLAAAVLDQGVTEKDISGVSEEAQKVLLEAMEGNQSISRIIQGALSKEEVIIYGTPVYDGNEIVGALAASSRIDIFREILSADVSAGGTGYVNMIDLDGNYVVRSGKDDISGQLTNVFSSPYFDEADTQAAKQQLQDTGKFEFSFSYNGERYKGLIQSVGIHEWCLFSVINTRMGSREIYVLIRAAGVLLGMMLFLMLGLLSYGCRLVWKNGIKLRQIAYYDSLTGACNMLCFRQNVEENLRTDRKYSILALNVYQFKFINEIYGREQGDRVLRFIKDQIEKNLEPGEIFCRETADIFYIYTTETDKERLEKRLKILMDSVTRVASDAKGDYQLLLCCGAAVVEENEKSQTLDEIMTHVMLALERAKEVHQNNVMFFDKELHQKEILGNYVESHMNQALEDREFQLYLQPKISLNSGKTAGAEALVRWFKSDGGMIYPDQFIPLFEANGFCVQFDMYMVESVCRKLREWIDQGAEPFPVSVNQSKRTFYEKDYISWLIKITDKYRIPAELITLEILEGFAFENVEEVNRKIEGLQEKGFRVSLDDFGSEYSSMNTLGKIRINELKLDRWFLKDVAEGKKNVKVIMEQIIELAHKLNIPTVVEGVETLEDHDMIRELHCDYGQGYYYSRPVSADEFFASWLNQE